MSDQDDGVDEDAGLGIAEETSASQTEADPTDLGDDISPDELGIDLESLSLSSPSVLGKAKPKPMLAESAAVDKRPVGRPPKEDEGVFAWCEQFSYTPGVEFLKLSRLFPKIWEGVTIGGFIEEVYEPIDEHWLADRWGGGSYQLDAYQRDPSGRSRKTLTKFVEISGLPKAFMGPDGRLHALPSTRTSNTSSRRSSDVLRRRMGLGRFRDDDDDGAREGDDFGERESLPRPRPIISRPPSVEQPVTDASALYKTLQETRKSENEALGVLREAQKDVHSQMQATAQQQQEMYKVMLEQQKEEMRRLREESKQSAQSSSAPFKELLQFMTTQGGSNASRENLEVLRAAHDTAINSLTREHNSHIDDIRKTYESRHSQMSDELQRLRAQFSQEVERIRADYLEKEKSAKEDAFRNYQSQLEIVRTQGTELRERHRDELSTLTREKNEIISQLRQEVSEMRAALLTKDHEARVGLLEKENALRRDAAERERALNDKLTAVENAARISLVERETTLRADATAREKLLADRISQLETTGKTTLVERENILRVEYAEREKKLMDRISQLELLSKTSVLERETALRAEYAEREKKLTEKVTALESEGRTSILEERQRIREDFEERYNAKLQSIQEAYEAKLANTTHSAELRAQTAEKESKVAIDSARRELKAEYESKTARLEAQIESLKKEFDSRERLTLERSQMERDAAQRERENQRILLENTAQSREVLGEMSRKQLEARIKELTRDLERAREDQELLAQQVVPESNDPFEQLEKLNQIKERLKAHGFIDQTDKSKDDDDDDEEEKEEKPKDLLGKILHYGPQFVAPILQRIDAATAAAQQAVDSQQDERQQEQAQELLKTRQQLLEQQQRLELERQAAVDREMSLRERREMLTQRRIEREAAMEAERSRESLARQIAESRQAPVRAPNPLPRNPAQTESVEVDDSPLDVDIDVGIVNENPTTTTDREEPMSDQAAGGEGYEKLAEYLDKAMSDKKSAQTIVREIKGALMLGMFSRDVLNEVLAQDFDTLVGILSGYKSSLHSPKARVALKQVMEGLKK